VRKALSITFPTARLAFLCLFGMIIGFLVFLSPSLSWLVLLIVGPQLVHSDYYVRLIIMTPDVFKIFVPSSGAFTEIWMVALTEFFSSLQEKK